MRASSRPLRVRPLRAWPLRVWPLREATTRATTAREAPGGFSPFPARRFAIATVYRRHRLWCRLHHHLSVPPHRHSLFAAAVSALIVTTTYEPPQPDQLPGTCLHISVSQVHWPLVDTHTHARTRNP